MPAKRVKLSYGVTINCGNFEFVRVDLGLERDLEPNETLKQAYSSMFQEIVRETSRKARIAAKKVQGV